MPLSNYTTSNFSSNGSIDIPGNAQDITVTLKGQKGSSGATGGGGAGSGGSGRQGKFSLPNYQERTLSFTFKGGGSAGSGGTWSEQVTVPQTCNATSNISANWSSNGVLQVSGAGNANITINQSTSDDPGTAGTSFSNANISGNFSGSANFSFNNGNFSDSARFQAGNVQFNINGLQKPLQRFNNNQCLKLRDGDGDDTNTSFCIGSISQQTYSYDCTYYVTNNYTGYDGGQGGSCVIMSDSYSGGIIAVAGGGGGGGGGHTKNSKSGGNGNAAASFGAAAISNTCKGSNGTTDNQGGGGGGGGGVCPAASGGAGGTPNGSGGKGGNGGISAYNSSYITITQNTTTSSANANATVKYRTISPEINSFTVNKTTMINNGTDSITLQWSTTDAIDVDLRGNNNDSTYGNSYVDVALDNTSGLVRQPTDDIQYTLRACSYGDVCVTQSVFITVYQVPTSNFYALDEEITIGSGGTTLEWQLTGDGVNAEIDQGIGAILTTGSQAINPSETTTYTLSLTSLGGDLTDSVTVKVFQIPQLQVSYPSDVFYDVDFDVITKTKFCNNGGNMTVKQYYFATDGGLSGNIVDQVYDLGADASAEFQADFRTVTTTVAPAWNDLGPYRLDILIQMGGSGGVVNDSITKMVIIDLKPDPFSIPANPDELPDTDPVVSPDETKSGFVGSPIIPINGIDIPVEIRADKPIQVRFDPDDPNQESSWKNLRQYNP